jgi:hypothetical protein
MLRRLEDTTTPERCPECGKKSGRLTDTGTTT